MLKHFGQIVSTFIIASIAACSLSAQEVIVLTQSSSPDTCRILYADSSTFAIWRSDEAYTAGKASQYGVRIDPMDLNRVVVEKESHLLSGAGKGFLIGAGAGAAIGLLSGNDNSGLIRFTAGEKAVALGVMFGVAGSLIGGTAGAIEGIDDAIFVDGSRDRYLEALPGLKECAMFPIVPPPGLGTIPMRESRSFVETTEPPRQEGGPTGEPSTKRFHISLGTSVQLFGSPGGDIRNAFNSSGFGGTVRGWFGPTTYPTTHGNPFSYDVSGELGMTDHLRLGVAWNANPTESLYGSGGQVENTRGEAYTFFCTYLPSPADPSLGRRTELALIVGVSYNYSRIDGRLTYASYTPAGQTPNTFHEEGGAFGLYAAVSYDYYFSSVVSIQCKAGGYYFPSSVQVQQAQYTFYQNPADVITLKAHSVNFSRFDLSTGLRFHF